jgi:hypothetical protein
MCVREYVCIDVYSARMQENTVGGNVEAFFLVAFIAQAKTLVSCSKGETRPSWWKADNSN